MQASVDIHCHIMPGVDDGSRDIATSLEMLRIAARSGITDVILTPHHKPMHHNVSPEHNRIYTEKLKETAEQYGIRIRLYPGNEIYYSDETQRELEEGKICTLAGSDYVLVEFHPTNPYRAISNAIYQVQGAGFIPIIAHVERYSDIVSHPAYVEELIDKGCYIQINAAAVMGDYGFGIKRFVKKLLKNRQVHFVATDAHDTARRAPRLAECRAYIERKFDKDYAERIFHDNPMSVIRNEII
ncbi:MAG: protein-tyrosine-phosphatase [Butyrivibrio sp.]|nr:protein-tyrosine-phosphatase [Butyrivibrio sp.]